MKKQFKCFIFLILNFFSFSSFAATDEMNLSSWMSKLPDSTALSAITLPGSHDAGMYETRNCTFFVSPSWSQTQAHSIYGQAEAGARYFDIRVDFDHDKLVTYHRTDFAGCSGAYLEAVLDNAATFLQRNPNETLILKFSHTRNDSGKNSDEITRKVVAYITEKYAGILYKSVSLEYTIAKTPIGKLRGKIIAVFDSEYHPLLNERKGILPYVEYKNTANQYNTLYVFDQYANTDNVDYLKNDQRSKLLSYGGLGQNYLFLLSWTLTGKIGKLNIKDLANSANARLPEFVQEIKNHRYPMPNIIYVDFVDKAIGNMIVQSNFS